MLNYTPRAKPTLSNEEACRNKKIERPRPESALRTRRLRRRTARHTNSPSIQCMVPNRMVPNRMVPNRMVPNRMVPNRMVPNRMVPNRMVPNRMVPNRMVPNRTVPNRMVPNGMVCLFNHNTIEVDHSLQYHPHYSTCMLK